MISLFPRSILLNSRISSTARKHLVRIPSFLSSTMTKSRKQDSLLVDSSNSLTTQTLPATCIPAPRTFNDGLPLPRMMVFDLDYTLWPFWVDTHVSPPLKPHPSSPGQAVRDSSGGSYGFYPEVAGILSSIKEHDMVLGAASRTCAPDLARKMLKMLHLPQTSQDEKPGKEARLAIDIFDHMEIYPGSKTTHFKKLQKASGVSFEEMLFFDDESRNKNVEELGVVMYLIRDGVSREEIDRGVEMWRKRKGRTSKES